MVLVVTIVQKEIAKKGFLKTLSLSVCIGPEKPQWGVAN